MRTLTSTALALSFVLAGTAAAQATVAGRVSVLERDGKRTTDLENAVLWLEPIAGKAPAPEPGMTEIVMESRRYRPAVRVVAPGSSVRFPNYDPFRHNVFSDAGPTRFDLGLFGRGETRDARFAAPGVYPIFCNIHSKMVSFVVAVASPWRAQAGADGTYHIPDVPAGRYRLHAWHDRGGEQTREVEVVADGGVGRVQADVELDARGWRFVAHKNKYGRDYPPETRDRY
jgi:plastocyanin